MLSYGVNGSELLKIPGSVLDSALSQYDKVIRSLSPQIRIYKPHHHIMSKRALVY